MNKIVLSLIASSALAASLGADEYALDPIVVTATKTEQSIKNITTNVDVITSEEIEEKHYMSVTEALDSLPGVSITESGGLGTTRDVYIRGMETSKVLVLIDGIRYQDPSNTDGANFANLMISDIDRIEVIKGGQSGIWGADASAGVINIITKSAQNGTHIGGNTEYGSFATKKWGGYISHKTDLYDLKLAANRIMSNSFTATAPYGTNIKDYENDPYANTTLNLSGHLRPTSTDTVGVHYTNIAALSNYDSYNAPNSLQRDHTKSKLYGVSYDKLLGAHTLSFKSNLSEFTTQHLDAAWATDVKASNGKTRQIELSDQFHYRDKDFIVAGIMKEWFEIGYDQVNTTAGQNKTDSAAVYVTNSNLFGDLILTESLRRDDYGNFGGKTTGKIGAKYNLGKELYVSGNYGTAYTAPNLIQMVNPWGASNGNLKPETSKSYDTSIGYKNVTATYFENHVQNLINWYDPTPLNWFNNDAYYTNTNGTSTFKGYEFAYKQNLSSALLVGANYTYLSRFENEQGQELKRRPKEEAKFSFDYYGIEQWHIGLNGHYVGTRYNDDNRQGQQTGRYTLWNFVINYDLSNSIQLYGKIDNITDKYYQSVDGYATSPRAFYAGLKASF